MAVLATIGMRDGLVQGTKLSYSKCALGWMENSVCMYIFFYFKMSCLTDTF